MVGLTESTPFFFLHAWPVPAKSGGHQLEKGRGGHTEARGSGAVQVGLDLSEVSTGRHGPYTTHHRLTNPRVRGPGGLAGFFASGLMD